MEDFQRPKAPGLKWRKRAGGIEIPYWFPDEKAVLDGYLPKSVNLQALSGIALVAKCEALQRDVLAWRMKLKQPEFNGTFASLLDAYQRDPESSFQTVNANTRRSYTSYAKLLTEHIGVRRIDRCDGRDVKGWFREWRTAENGDDMLPKARMVFAVLKAAVSFGVLSRFAGCADFKTVIGELQFPLPDRRAHAPTAEQIVAARAAAHAAGLPRKGKPKAGGPLRALAYALQFETTLRQQDVIGQWVPMSDPRPSTILHKGEKWIGLKWSDIDANLIIKALMPSKTHKTTKVTVSFDLTVCPMVMEELALIPQDKRTGPLIINERNGRPYRRFASYWNEDFTAAGIPAGVWNRDFRAGGITEGGRAGASKDDRRKLAGHAQEKTTEIYDRDMVEAHRRVMAARTEHRKK